MPRGNLLPFIICLSRSGKQITVLYRNCRQNKSRNMKHERNILYSRWAIPCSRQPQKRLMRRWTTTSPTALMQVTVKSLDSTFEATCLQELQQTNWKKLMACWHQEGTEKQRRENQPHRTNHLLLSLDRQKGPRVHEVADIGTSRGQIEHLSVLVAAVLRLLQAALLRRKGKWLKNRPIRRIICRRRQMRKLRHKIWGRRRKSKRNKCI